MIRLVSQAAIPDPVLAAAADCYVRLGVGRTTAADIADAVGISRATLYRRFGGTDKIFLGVLTRESEAMARDAAVRLAGIDDPATRIVEGMLFSIGEIQRRPVHAALFGSTDAAWAARQALRATALHRIGEEAIRPLVVGAAGARLPESETGDLVDWILRLLISYASVPGPAGLDATAIRRQLGRLLGPAVDALLVPAAAETSRTKTSGAAPVQ